MLASGRELFARAGCAGLSLPVPSKHAGVNLGMFHDDFKTRNIYLRGLLQQMCEEMFDSLRSDESHPGPALERLRAALTVLAHFARARRRAGTRCAAAAAQPCPPRRAPRIRFMNTRTARMAAFAAAGLTACTPAAETAWSGYAEGEYVHVAAPLAGRLATLAVARGSDVAAGAPLFALDDDSEIAAQAEAAARVAVARAQADNTTKGRRVDEIAVTQAQWQQAKAAAVVAHAELARQTPLVAQGFISASRLDDARAAVRAADARVAEVDAGLRVARLPARADERAAAQAGAQAAEQVLAQARWRAAQKQQFAASAARVADTFFRVGEWVAAGQPVLALLPPGAIKARFFVPEPELAALATGQAVTLHCDGCGAPIRARIDYIATQAEYTPPVIYSNAQRSRLVFMVEARPDSADATRLKPGQPLDVRPATPPVAGK